MVGGGTKSKMSAPASRRAGEDDVARIVTDLGGAWDAEAKQATVLLAGVRVLAEVAPVASVDDLLALAHKAGRVPIVVTLRGRRSIEWRAT